MSPSFKVLRWLFSVLYLCGASVALAVTPGATTPSTGNTTPPESSLSSGTTGATAEKPLPPLKTPLQKVRLQLRGAHQFQNAGYYAAVAKGFYRDAGLEVELREGSETLQVSDIASRVIRGEVEFGVGSSALLVDRAFGVPVVILATIFQHSPLVLVTRPETTQPNILEIANRPVMMHSRDAEILAFFKSEGITLKHPPVPYTGDFADLLSGRVGAIATSSLDWLYKLKEQGIEYSLFNPRSAGIDFYGDNFFTSEEQVRLHPDRVAKFREATLKGWAYALKQPEEIIELIRAKYAPTKSLPRLHFEEKHTRQYVHPDRIPLGTYNEGRWMHIAETYEDLGLIKDARSAVEGLVYIPDAGMNLTPFYWGAGGALGALLLALCWGLPLFRINQKLKAQIAEKILIEEELRKAKEETEIAGEAKNRFLASISHEIRTPLNIVIGYAQTLSQKNNLSANDATALNAISESGVHLLRLIENVLDLSKIEAGRVELLPVDFDLGALLRGLKAVFQESCSRKGVSLVLAWQADRVTRVHGDEGKIRQVLFNLLGNAVKFSEKGEILIRVVAEGDQNFLFEVHDNGPGISPEGQSRIFEPFEQTNEGARKGGTGLGLAISQKLLHLMGSTFHLDSEVGKGSKFSFRLNLPPALNAPAPLEHRSFRERMLEQDCSVTALVVDDVALNRDIIKHMLEAMGCDVICAGSGEEALELAAVTPPDIAFIDMRMATMDGVETAKRMRKLVGDRRVQLVCFSASALGKDTDAYREAGFDDILPKPFRFEKVREAIEKLPNIRFTTVAPTVVPKEGDFIPEESARKLLDAVEIGDFATVKLLLDQLDRLATNPGSPLLAKLRNASEGFDAKTMMSILASNSAA